MKVLGIGNAIVDVLCKVDDQFLTKNSLIKSTMKLIDEKEFFQKKHGTNFIYKLFIMDVNFVRREIVMV